MGIFSQRFYGEMPAPTRYIRGADGRESWTPIRSRPTFDPTLERQMTSRFPGVCRDCKGKIEAGAPIFWSKSAGAKHVECPVVKPEPNTEVGIIAAQADALLDEYAALKADQERKASAIRKVNASVMTRKAIYRVRMSDGKRYGVDFVNVALVPNEKYGSVKVSEFRGESIGVIKVDGSFMAWRDVDETSARVKAIREAADVILNAADPIEYAKAFAVESVACWRCGDDLVDDISRERMLGPVCYKKVQTGA